LRGQCSGARRILGPGAAAFLLAGLLAAGPAGDAPAFARRAEGDWLLLYVGAEDCAPCQAWRRARWDAVRAGYASTPVGFVELRAPRSAEVLDDAHWPEALRGHRASIPPGAGLPLWLLAHDGRAVRWSWGSSRWDAEMAPALRRIAAGGTPRPERAPR
jgi:hypothetical protein